MNRNVTAISGYGQVNLAVEQSSAPSTVTTGGFPGWQVLVGAAAGGLATAWVGGIPLSAKARTRGGAMIGLGMMAGALSGWLLARGGA